MLEKRSGRPLARARVAIHPIQAKSAAPSSRVLTDSLGHFTFPQLPAGAYFLSAEKSGYAPARYGQTEWKGTGTPIVLEANGRFAAEFRLSKFGVLTGEVSDENGVGLPRFRVLAYRDGRPLKLAGHGTTDDRGVYRIAGLEPGRYHARTGPRTLEDGTGLLPTYFGQTASARQSQFVEVRLDEDTSGINITPLPGKLFRLSGTATWPGVSSVELYSDLGAMRANVDAAGRFVFDQLSPGSYELLAESNDPPPLAAYRKLWLGGDVEDLVLNPSSAPTLVIRCEERDSRAFDPRQVSPFVRRTAPMAEEGMRRILCGETTTLSPGAWQLAVATPPQYYVAFVNMDDKLSVSNELTLMPGQDVELELVLSSQPASLEGRVTVPGGQPAIGATVFLRALDQNVRDRFYGKGAAKAGPKGEYSIEGLPPGPYQVLSSFAFASLEQVDWSVSPSKTVQLEEGRRATLDLELAGAP